MNYTTKVTVRYWRIDEENKPKRTKGKPPVGLLCMYKRVTNENVLNFFYPATRGGKTEVTIQVFDEHGDPVTRFVGVALCSLSDNFSYKTGRELAYSRAKDLYLKWYRENYKCSIKSISLSVFPSHATAWVHRKNSKLIPPVMSYSVETPLRLKRVRALQDALNTSI